MASLCPRCLSELHPGSAVCPSCGAEQGATHATGAEAPLLLPAVVPPPPGAPGSSPVNQGPTYQGMSGRPTAPSGADSPGFASATRPPAFGKSPQAGNGIDAGSPASLLGPSAHAAADAHSGHPSAAAPPCPEPAAGTAHGRDAFPHDNAQPPRTRSSDPPFSEATHSEEPPRRHPPFSLPRRARSSQDRSRPGLPEPRPGTAGSRPTSGSGVVAAAPRRSPGHEDPRKAETAKAPCYRSRRPWSWWQWSRLCSQ